MNPFLFLGAGTPWVYALAAALAERGSPTAAIAPYDRPNYRRLRPRWPQGEPPALLRREWWVLPAGYAGRLDALFAPVLRWKLARTLAALGVGRGGASAWVVAPYPWFARALAGVPDTRLIYYNLDDYPLYNPARAAGIRRQEAALVRRAALTLCLSLTQAEALRARFPARAGDIRHFPLGVVPGYLNPAPEAAPAARTVGYVGNLSDRVDWRLAAAAARALPDVEFFFVGGLEDAAGGGARPGWLADRAAALALPNVRQIGPVPQDDVPGHYWGFALCWIPYATDHAFNRASCPTKIMDGLASGRPVLSTDVPECRLYPEWITVAGTAEAMAAPPAPERARAQAEFARQNVWGERARQLAGWCAEAQGAANAELS